MDIRFPWDTLRRIKSLESIQNRTPRQEDRLQKLREVYTQGQGPSITPSYPTRNTRISPRDVLYKTREDWARAVLRDINHPTGPIRSLNNPLIKYNPNPTQGFYPHASSFKTGQKSFVSLDIETDDYGHPLSVIAHRFIQDKAGQFQNVDTYQRYYKTHGWDIRSTQAVHGFTPSILNSLRRQQGADYGKTYKGQEIEDLRKYLGNSIIVGHNIGEFDLNKLFPEGNVANSTIDTLSAARNAWKGAKNSLDHVYYRLFGKTMEEDGLYHHDANADVIASMRIFEAMAKNKGTVGQSIRYIIGSRGKRHLVEYDEYMKSMVAKGSYRSSKGKRRVNLHEVYMRPEEMGFIEYDENGNKRWVGGYHEDKPLSVEELADQQLLRDAELQAAEWANKLQQKQGAKSLKSGGQTWLSNTVAEQELFHEFNQFNNYKRLGLVQKIASAKSEESILALRKAAGYSADGTGWGSLVEMANTMRSAKEREKIQMQHLRIDRYADKGMLSEKQANKLKLLTGSYEDLVDATDDVIDANQRLLKVYESIGKIKPYDMNQYIASAKGQWSGIMGASRGVVPNFVRNTIGRLGDAAFNAVDRSMAPWNAFSRTWNSGIGSALTGGLGMAFGPAGVGAGMLISGGVNAASQIYGNYKQAGMEMTGLNIQNNLNTLGALVTWISTPFQLLHKATKLLIGSFTGLTLSVRSLMTSGIGLMAQMGNPLTDLTGMNYGAYIRSTMMDVASLMRKGTMSSTIENFASQKQLFYTMGEVDTKRLIASSLLGVYDKVYTPDIDAEASYSSMANKLLNDLNTADPSKRANIMALAEIIDKSLPQLLQTARTLGITDVNMLKDPGNRGMYWRPLSDTDENNEVRRFRWTQYEYNSAKEQMGFSKMRVADTLWRRGGKQIYNVFNGMIDSIAVALETGKWDSVVKQATEIWNTARDAFKNAWDGIKNTLKGEDGDNSIVNTFKGIGLLIENVALKAALKILTIWDNLMNSLADKLQGAIAYLSTIQLKPHWDWKEGLSFSMETIDTAKIPEGRKGIYNLESGKVQSGMEGYAALMDALFPDMSYKEKMSMTKDKLEAKLHHLPGVIKDGVLDTPTLDLPDYFIHGLNLGHNPELIEPLMDYLGKASSEGTGFRLAAAAYRSPLYEYLDKSAAFDTTGIGAATRQFTSGVEDIASNLISAQIADNYARVDMYFRDNTGKKAMIGADSKGTVFSKDLILLQQMVPKGMELVVNQIK